MRIQARADYDARTVRLTEEANAHNRAPGEPAPSRPFKNC